MELPWVGCVWLGGLPLTAVPPALLPYVPRVAPGAMPGKVTATTFVLERPHCIFDPLANASDAVWLAVAFADASTAFKNPTSSAEVPLYEGLPTARAYMTLEMAAAAYGCSAPGAAVLRVGGDTACHGRHPAVCPAVPPGPGCPPALQDPPRPSGPAPHAAPRLRLWLHTTAPWPVPHQVNSVPSLIASFVVFQPNHRDIAWTCWVCHPCRPPGSGWRGSEC
uniref:Uroplakin 3B n=1 Tax=Pavo cristatus TaxID=9049 RepID=A0A8C9F2Y1_PAVCR